MPRVLMVCTGNICRSVMAHAVLVAQAQAADITVSVDSAGVSAEEVGNRPDPRAQQVLTAAGYQVPNHRARQVCDEDFTNFDLILAMTSAHLAALQRRAKHLDTTAQIKCYRDYDPAGAGDVPDPWYGDYADFEDTLACVNRVTPQLLADLAAD